MHAYIYICIYIYTFMERERGPAMAGVGTSIARHAAKWKPCLDVPPATARRHCTNSW